MISFSLECFQKESRQRIFKQDHAGSITAIKNTTHGTVEIHLWCKFINVRTCFKKVSRIYLKEQECQQALIRSLKSEVVYSSCSKNVQLLTIIIIPSKTNNSPSQLSMNLSDGNKLK